MGRAFFSSLGRLLPDTTIHIQTINGGAGAAAVKEVASATGNLITISIFGNGPVYSEFLSATALPVGISRLQWLGSLTENARVVSMRKSLGSPNIDTLRKIARQPIVPSTAAGSPNNIESLLLNSIAGTHFKVVPGFKSGQIEAMLVAGDADVRLAGSHRIAPSIARGDMVAILRIGDGAYPASMQSLPTLRDVARADVPDELLLMLETLNRLGRPYAAAPNTDPAVVAALQATFPLALEDPEFRKFMAADGFFGGWTTGQELREVMETLLSDPNLKSIVRHYVDCGKAMSEDPVAECG